MLLLAVDHSVSIENQAWPVPALTGYRRMWCEVVVADRVAVYWPLSGSSMAAMRKTNLIEFQFSIARFSGACCQLARRNADVSV